MWEKALSKAIRLMSLWALRAHALNVNQNSQFFDSLQFAQAIASERRVVTQCETIITLQC